VSTSPTSPKKEKFITSRARENHFPALQLPSSSLRIPSSPSSTNPLPQDARLHSLFTSPSLAFVGIFEHGSILQHIRNDDKPTKTVHFTYKKRTSKRVHLRHTYLIFEPLIYTCSTWEDFPSRAVTVTEASWQFILSSASISFPL